MTYNGFLFIVDEPHRAEKIERRLLDSEDFTQNSFTDVVSIPDWQPRHTEIAFLGLDRERLHGFALVQRGRRVATAKYQIKFLRFTPFEPPLLVEDVSEQLPDRLQHHFIRTSEGRGGRVPEKTWQALVNVIFRQRPQAVDEFRHLEQLRTERPDYLRQPGGDVVVFERDSVNMALRFAGLDEDALRDWAPHETPAPFLQDLESVRLTEDKMIERDAEVFGNWQRLEEHVTGATIFKGPRGQRLTVMNVNRHKIEHTLGVDLLYYSDVYSAFVLVQYKRMRKEGNDYVYRPDANHEVQVRKMQEFCRSFPPEPSIGVEDFRLSPMPFYFKLCQEVIFKPDSVTMIPGMYIPLDYWKQLAQSEFMKGSRKGLRVSQAMSPRHFSNTEFSALVSSGWIGSRLNSTQAVTEIVRNAIEDGRSLTLARKVGS